MYRLVFDQHTARREAFTTRASLLLIGRSPLCQLRLLDNGVGDRHAAIERGADGYYIRDLSSSNGVRVNDQPVTVQRLATGDVLELGAAKLTFEIVHQPPPPRRSVDLLQVAAFILLAGLLIGQAVLFFNIFSVHRSRKMSMETGTEPRGISMNPSAGDTTTPVTVTASTNVTATVTSISPATPAVLSRLLRIQKVTRIDAAGEVVLRVDVRAGVGERELDAAAAAVSVQFYRRDTGKAVALEALRFRVPEWENFSVKTFVARFTGAPSQLAGYVVRTSYRNQLQDERIEPSGLIPASGISR